MRDGRAARRQRGILVEGRRGHVVALARLVVRVERFVLDGDVEELSPAIEAPYPHPLWILLEVGVAHLVSDLIPFRDLSNGVDNRIPLFDGDCDVHLMACRVIGG